MVERTDLKPINNAQSKVLPTLRKMIYLQYFIANIETTGNVMETQKLQQFAALAELKHFNRAAERCHISPSTLTRTIQSMEQELQAKLFERNNRSVALTPQGKLFLRYAREMLQQWETLRHRMLSENDSLSGAISIYCSVTASYSFLYDILTDFRQLHPRIEIRLHTGDPADALERVLAGREDIAIAAKPERLPTDVSFKSFARSPLVFIAPTDDALLTEIVSQNPADFWQHLPLIISERGIARERLDHWFREQQLNASIYAQVSGNEALVSMVSLGFGVGLVPKIVVDNSPLSEKVKLFEQQIEIEAYEVGVCVLERRLKSPLVKAFWEKI